MASQKQIKSINDGLTKMLDITQKLQVSFEATQKTIVEGTQAIDAQAKKSIEVQKQKTGANKAHREDISKEQKQAQELLKAKQNLELAYKNNAIEILKIKKVRQDMLKTQKLEIAAGKGQAKTYEQLSARYRLAAQRAKDLSVQYGVNSDQAREAIASAKEYNDSLKEVDESLGNHQRNVGNYNEKLEELKGAFLGASGGLGNMASGFADFFKNPYVALFAGIAGAVTGLISIMKSGRAGTALLDKGMLELSSRASVLKNKIREGTEEISEGTNKMAGFNKILIALNGGHDVGASMLGKETDAYKEQIDAVKELSRELIDLNNAYIDIENELLVEIATQQGLAEEQRIIADDATRSLQERRKAAQEAFRIEEQASKASVKLANERLSILETEIEIGIKAGELQREQDGTIKSLTQNGIELERTYSEATIAVIEASNNLTNKRLENQKRLAEINQDDFEQELDFILDIADAQKTVNEQQIADTSRSLGEREKLLLSTKNLIEESFEDQLDLFKSQLGIELDRNKLLNLNNQEIFEYARGLQLSEIATNRLREVIVERRKAVQDLGQAERDLNNERLAAIDKYTEGLEKENDAFTDELEKGLEDEEKLVEDSLKRQEQLRLKAGQKEIEDFKNKEEQKKEALKEAGGLLLETITLFADQRIEQANRVVEEERMKTDSAERNLDRQIALAEAGHANNVQDAQRMLDLQKATQRKALDEKKRAVEQKQKLETIEQGISIITSVANIIQGFSSIPIVGWALGIAAGVAMLAAFASQKRQAKAATQTFGEGGVVDLEGGSHASGNDIHFGRKDGKDLYAEGGEKGAIFNKKASRKYGPLIDNFVKDANRLNLEDRYSRAFDIGAMPIIVENNSNFDSRDIKETNALLRQLIANGGNSDTILEKRRVTKRGNVTYYTKHG